MPFHAELILKNGTVVNHDGVGQRDIAVSGGRIIGIGFTQGHRRVPSSIAPGFTSCPAWSTARST
jgi:dihydroorotase-like cyclic amidohydrolase